ncbi:MAG: HEAT repeat domain-containing protein [Nitrospirae bacterium]|nr:HEAT repeat domain-containing protein [Nitrospirota bacterium]
MEVSDDIKEVKDILQNILKAKKTFRMYPRNNPVYLKTLDDTYAKFKDFLVYKDHLTFKFKQNSILYDTEQIYYNPDKEDNIALFFFKDGLRELTFKNGLTQEELEEFLKIIAMDFDREAIDDDIVTLLWEKDFQNISYIVDENFLIDIDEEDYASTVEEKVKEKVTDLNDLMRAYSEGFQEEDVKKISIVSLTDNDLKLLVEKLEKDTDNKLEKLVNILFEIIYQYENKSELENVSLFLKDIIQFSMKHGELKIIVNILKMAQQFIEEPSFKEEDKKYVKMLYSYTGSEEIISLLAEILDSGIEIEGGIFEEFIRFIDKNSIPAFIKFLGELKTIRARKSVIEALIILGSKDIQSIAKGLNDPRWYVVRNIIYILRRIGDRRSLDYLIKTVKHPDIRVRKEVIKTLGELGGKEVIQILKEFLDDTDMQVRIASVKSLGNTGSEAAKKIIFEKILDKAFKDKDIEEKKDFFEVLSKWKDQDVLDFLVKILRKKTFFNRAKLYENKACAVFCLGLIGSKDVLPILDEFKNSGNKLLRDYTQAALKRIEYGS